MKYYKLEKGKKIEEINKEDIGFEIRPATIYYKDSTYYCIGDAGKKFLSIIERIKMNKTMEEYWDRVANNWIEKLEKENINLPY